MFNLAGLGLAPFSIPALAEFEVVAEKLRALVQRAQLRDLFDLRLYLVESGWHLEPNELRTCVDRKLALTKHKKWRAGLWRAHLDEIEPLWDATLTEWVHPDRLPPCTRAVADVFRRLRELRLD